MADRIDKKELANRVAQRLAGCEPAAEQMVNATLEEIYEALKWGESVSPRHFGTFCVRPERESWVLRFNPSQRLRALLGWSSTYKGEL